MFTMWSPEIIELKCSKPETQIFSLFMIGNFLTFLMVDKWAVSSLVYVSTTFEAERSTFYIQWTCGMVSLNEFTIRIHPYSRMCCRFVKQKERTQFEVICSFKSRKLISSSARCHCTTLNTFSTHRHTLFASGHWQTLVRRIQ